MPPDRPRPDFFIIGAMKCGTTSLHALLDQRPDVFMPAGEVNLFSIDDFEQQRQFFHRIDGQWTDHDFEGDRDRYFAWWERLYEPRRGEPVAGEDAPSYLPSTRAPDRIAVHAPDARFIVLLRDPVERCYSQYWHEVRRFSAFFSFEDALRFAPDLMVRRSCYLRQIDGWLQHFDRSRFLFVIFEDFVRDQGATMRDVERFLGLTPFEHRPAAANRGRYPRRHRLRLLYNYLFRDLYGRDYFTVLPDMPEPPPLSPGRSLLHRLLGRIVSPARDEPPPMESGTRRFLSALLRRENESLDRLLGRDLSEVWPTFGERSQRNPDA